METVHHCTQTSVLKENKNSDVPVKNDQKFRKAPEFKGKKGIFKEKNKNYYNIKIIKKKNGQL